MQDKFSQLLLPGDDRSFWQRFAWSLFSVRLARAAGTLRPCAASA
jgi:hypothetical protein